MKSNDELFEEIDGFKYGCNYYLYPNDENKIVLDGSFSSPEEMAECIIKNHNDIVKPGDKVIVVGDVCYQKTPEMLPLISRMNGNKILVRGNHDKVFTNEQLYPYFDEIVDDGKGFDIKSGNINCYVTHYPTEGSYTCFNLVGHIHSAWKYQLNCFNVGVDVNHFKPVDLDSIPFHFKAICEYYDEDVWVAYNQINTNPNTINRGKKGTYFRPIP